jgi:hypothetical protein
MNRFLIIRNWLLAGSLLLSSAFTGFNVIQEVRSDEISPLVNLPVLFGSSDPLGSLSLPPTTSPVIESNTTQLLPKGQGLPPGVLRAEPPDPVIQTEMGSLGSMPGTLSNFEGVANSDNLSLVIPPDTEGDVGYDPSTNISYYVQWVNLSFAVWDVTGTPLQVVAPTPGNALFQNLGGICAVKNSGDPLVVFDSLAERWVLTQFAIDQVNQDYHQCFAISKTGDPTGTYWLYDYHWGLPDDTIINDYPKLGVWPDAYYMTANQFNGYTWAGAGVAAMDRLGMLSGDPLAPMIYFDLYDVNPAYGGMLPADLDGRPSSESLPGLFIEVDDAIALPPQDAIRLWEFHVNWGDPGASTFGIGGDPNQVLPVDPFSLLPCVLASSRDCIPQPATSEKLDAIGDRLMYRLAYRSHETYQSLAVNHTVDAGDGRAGIRWYELRNYGSGWVVWQQSTYAPDDGNGRWMGSLAMDGRGNLALGYSISGVDLYPSIRYAGRLAGDPPGHLTQAETSLMVGGGSQLSSLSRWGDYSTMSIDPADDCTFYYTQQYYSLTSLGNWRTRIGSLRFPTCTSLGSISGQVTDAVSGQPLGGVAVGLGGGVETETDQQGFYHFSDILTGSYEFIFTKYGYNQGNRSARVRITGTQLDMALMPADGITLTGTVIDGTPGGHAWPLYARVEADYNSGHLTAFTNPLDGSYSLNLLQSTPYTIRVNALLPGYEILTQVLITPLQVAAMQDFQLLRDLQYCNAGGYQADALVTEDFEYDGGGFSTSVAGSAQTSWAYGMPVSGPLAAHSGNLVWATSLDGDYYNYEDGYLVSPVIDLSAYTGGPVYLKWWEWLQSESGYDWADVEISPDGGINWSDPIHGPFAGDVALKWSPRTLRIPAEYVTALFRMRFHFTSDMSLTAPGWYIDDFSIEYGCDAVSGGFLVGSVEDLNTGEPLPGARVSMPGHPEFNALAVETPDDDLLPDAIYALFSPINGPSDFSADMFNGYQTQTLSGEIFMEGITQLDFSLSAGRLSIQPSFAELLLAPNATGLISLALSNMGSAGVEYAITEYRASAPIAGAGVPLGTSWIGDYKSNGLVTDLGGKKILSGAPLGSPAAVIDKRLPLPWITISTEPKPVARSAGAIVNGLFYVIGGENNTTSPPPSIQIYNPETRIWTLIEYGMSEPITNHCLAVAGDDIYMPGGYQVFEGHPYTRLMVYSTTTQTWTEIASDPLPARRYGSACAFWGGRLYVIAGLDDAHVMHAQLWEYDPALPAGMRWTVKSSLPEASGFGAAISGAEGIYYAGMLGLDETDKATVYRYDPILDAWHSLPPLHFPRAGAGIWMFGNTLLVGGGGWSVYHTSVESYDLSQGDTGVWEFSNPLVQGRRTFAYGTDASGYLYAAGGWTRAVLAHAELMPLPIDIPWLQVTPASGSIAVGASHDITVEMDGAGMGPGRYSGLLVIPDDTPYLRVLVPVLMQLGYPWFFPQIGK